jgi:hypothetical protein
MRQHLSDMLDFKVVARARKIKVAMKLFTVEKKNGLLRLIQDGRPLNAISHRPPKMPLAPLHDLIRQVLSSNYVGTSDGKSFFYQFAIGEAISPFFGAKVRGSRGHHTIVTMRSLPMGFYWAPFLGQTFANVLIKDLGVAWVDNFIVTADSAEEYRRKKDEFLDRARKLNVELDDYDMKPQRQAELLGMYFDLETKTYRLSDDFVKKAEAGTPLRA